MSSYSCNLTPRSRFLQVFFTLLLLIIPTQAFAADGDLDPTFGSSGKLTYEIGGHVNQLLQQPDGKLILSGITSVARLTANNSLDPTFGAGGVVTFSSLVHDPYMFDAAVQPDGKILIAGSLFVFNTMNPAASVDFVLLRLNADGSLDPSFGNNGRVTTDFGGTDNARQILLTQDGKILIIGTTRPPGSTEFYTLTRYQADGSPDTSFGTDGKVFTGLNGGGDTYPEAALLTDGKIVLAGSLWSDLTYTDFMVARFNSDGSIDPSFGSGGKRVLDLTGDFDVPQSMAMQPDDKIIVTGKVFINGQYDTAVLRFQADGALDSSFGTNGKVVTDFFGGLEEVYDVVVQPDGKVVTFGTCLNQNRLNPFDYTAEDFALARYNADGSLDTSFGQSGKVNTDFFGNYDVATAALLQEDGKLLVAGYTGTESGSVRAALARYEGTVAPVELLGRLKDLVTSYHLQKGISTSLTAKLNAAQSAVSTGDMATACSAVSDFINQVAAQSGKKISSPQAARLTELANQIKSVLSCQ